MKTLFRLLVTLLFIPILFSCEGGNDSDELEEDEDSTPMIVVGNNDTVFYSTDGGDSWTEGISTSGENITDVECSGNNAVFITPTSIFYSDDQGASWTKSATSVNGMNSVKYGNDRFVVQKNGASSEAFSSDDNGATFNDFDFGTLGIISTTADNGNEPVMDGPDETLVFDGDRFLMISDTGDYLFESTDGLNWTQVILNFSSGANALLSEAEFIFKVNGNYFSSDYRYDVDFNNAPTAYSNGPSSAQGMVFVDPYYVAADSAGNFFISQDGQTWSSEEITDTATERLSGLVYNGEKYIMPSDAGKIYYTSNLTSFSSIKIDTDEDLNAIAICE